MTDATKTSSHYNLRVTTKKRNAAESFEGDRLPICNNINGSGVVHDGLKILPSKNHANVSNKRPALQEVHPNRQASPTQCKPIKKSSANTANNEVNAVVAAALAKTKATATAAAASAPSSSQPQQLQQPPQPQQLLQPQQPSKHNFSLLSSETTAFLPFRMTPI